MARHTSDSEAEVVFTLPLAYAEKFGTLFALLENKSADLGIKSFGVTLTSLEEVFLKLAEQDEHHDQAVDVTVNSKKISHLIFLD